MEDTLSHLVDQGDNLVLGEGTANVGWVSVPKLLGLPSEMQKGEIQCLGQVGCVWPQKDWLDATFLAQCANLQAEVAGGSIYDEDDRQLYVVLGDVVNQVINNVDVGVLFDPAIISIAVTPLS